MGIVNINHDSFCDDGTLDIEEAIQRARRLVNEGADIIDIGAESARTNRSAISEEEEIARLKPFVTLWAKANGETKPRDDDQVWPPLLSVNTWRPAVVNEMLPMGVDILNDIGALKETDNAELCARHGAVLLMMHSIGLPKVPHFDQMYVDIWETLLAFFEERVEKAKKVGLDESQMILDPGIDFAKQRDDNLAIYAQLDRLTNRFSIPVLLPISRKAVIGDVLDLPDPMNRDAGTIASLASGLLRGASIFRVHHVEAAYQALRVLWAIHHDD